MHLVIRSTCALLRVVSILRWTLPSRFWSVRTAAASPRCSKPSPSAAVIPRKAAATITRALLDRSELAQALRLSWSRKVVEGFFMRAESFYNFATYLDGVSNLRAYGGKSLHAQSHGESFLALFANRFEQGLYILDEPEAALSPQRQLSFLQIIHDLAATRQAQFLIATHSPIILSYPGAVLYDLDGEGINSIAYHDTEHYRLTRDFLNAPERYLNHLFDAAPRNENEDKS